MKPITVCISRSFTFSCLSQDLEWKTCRNRWSYELAWHWFTESWIHVFLPKVRHTYAKMMKQLTRLQPDPQSQPPLICAGHVFIMFSWAERDVLSSATEGCTCSNALQLTNTRRTSVRRTQDSLQNRNSTFPLRRSCLSYNAWGDSSLITDTCYEIWTHLP